MKEAEILIIEETKNLLASRVRTLRKEGYRVTGVSCAEDAIEAVKQQSYDLLVQAEEPGIDTVELLQGLRQISPALAALIMVDRDTTSAAIQSLGVGIQGFLVRPFTAADLKRTVSEAIARSHAIKETLQQKVLEILGNGSKFLVSKGELDKLVAHILEIISAETEADRVSILIVDEATQEMRVRVAVGLCQEAIEAEERMEQQIGEWVAKTAEPLMVNKHTSGKINPLPKQVMRQMGAFALICVPMVIKGKVVGALNAAKTAKGDCFADNDMEILSILAGQVAVAIENARLFESVRKQQLQMEKLLQQTVLAQEDERKRVAVDIHDGVAQWMVGALYRLQHCEALFAESKFEEVQAEIPEIRNLMERTIDELRRAIAALYPPALDELGLISALRQEVKNLEEQTGIATRFSVKGTPVRLQSSLEVGIYRVVQEALTNVRKHAEAAETGVQLQFQPERVLVAVHDNGKGFELDRALNSEAQIGHLGLLGMKERAEMLGGTLDIESKPGTGATLSFTFPIRPRA